MKDISSTFKLGMHNIFHSDSDKSLVLNDTR